MHHVGEDRDGNLGPDGESNLAHPAGRVRPHRDRAGQRPGPGVRVELDATEIVLTQVTPGGVAQPDPGRDQPGARAALSRRRAALSRCLRRLGLVRRRPGDPEHPAHLRPVPGAVIRAGRLGGSRPALSCARDGADREHGGRGEHAPRDRAVVGLAVPAEDVRRDHAGLVVAGVGVRSAGHVTGGPDLDPLTAGPGHLAPGGSGQRHPRRDLEPENVQAEPAEPRAPARGQQQPGRVDPAAVLEREREPVGRAFRLGGPGAEPDLRPGPAQRHRQDLAGEGRLAREQPGFRLHQRHL